MLSWLADWQRKRNAAKFDYTCSTCTESYGKTHEWRCNRCNEVVDDRLLKLHAITQHGFKAPNVQIER